MRLCVLWSYSMFIMFMTYYSFFLSIFYNNCILLFFSVFLIFYYNFMIYHFCLWFIIFVYDCIYFSFLNWWKLKPILKTSGNNFRLLLELKPMWQREFIQNTKKSDTMFFLSSRQSDLSYFLYMHVRGWNIVINILRPDYFL